MLGKGKQLLLSIVDTAPAVCHDAINLIFFARQKSFHFRTTIVPGGIYTADRTILESEFYVNPEREDDFRKHLKRYLLTRMCREYSEQGEPLWKMETKIGQNDMGR